jgi:8-oxo-dGTP diphosphatase
MRCRWARPEIDSRIAYIRAVDKLERVLVVAGLIIDRDRILLTQRPPGGSLPLEWELPGGKVESGEQPIAALARELAEEIGVTAEIGRIWDVLHHRYPRFELVMLVYLAHLAPGERVQRLQVADFEWVSHADLSEHPILAADRPLIERLVAEGIPAVIGTAELTPTSKEN